MKIFREEIPAQGLETAFTLAPEQAKKLSPLIAGVEEAPSFSLRLQPIRDNMVRADGIIKARFTLYCSRCLKENPFAVNSKIEVVFHPHYLYARCAGKEEVMLGPEDLEVYFYDGVELDLAALLRSELELLLPLAPLCRPPCRSLCPSCGAFEGACACGQKGTDPRFSRLAGLKIEND
ncbi:MAG: DUF177 domain-containing protein [Desulfarculales bacterium]|jgi:uncharacterized protein|nr:DUF177 domain-containing protein [Desulfarculales bacterium]